MCRIWTLEADGTEAMPGKYLVCIRPSIYICGVNVLCSTLYRPYHTWLKSVGPEL